MEQIDTLYIPIKYRDDIKELEQLATARAIRTAQKLREEFYALGHSVPDAIYQLIETRMIEIELNTLVSELKKRFGGPMPEGYEVTEVYDI